MTTVTARRDRVPRRGPAGAPARTGATRPAPHRAARVVKVALAAAVRNLPRLGLLILLGAALAASVVGFRSIERSSSAAIEESVRADFGLRAYALQSSDPSVAQLMASRSDAAPVTDDPGTLTASGLTTDVLVRSTTDPALQLGVLAGGRRPAAAGEALVSRLVAESLQIDIGDHVTLSGDAGGGPLLVTGLLRDPADVSSQQVFQIVESSPRFQPTRWLTDTNLLRDRTAGPLLNRTPSRIASLSSAIPLGLENKPPLLTATGYVPVGGGLLITALVLGATGMLARRWRKDSAALQAAGMAQDDTWFVFTAWVAGGLLLGELIGASACLIALPLSREVVSGWLGQDWGHVRESYPAAAVVVVATAVVAAAVARPGARLAWSAAERSAADASPLARRLTAPRRPQRRRDLLRHGVLAAVLVWWVYLVFVSRDDSSQSLALLLGVIVVASWPWILVALLARGLPAATRTVFRAMANGQKLAAAVAGTVILLVGAWSAQGYHAAGQGEAADRPVQPASSLVVDGAISSSTDLIRALYSAYGGRQIVEYRTVDESGSAIVRATTPLLVSCVSSRGAASPDDLPPECWPASTTTSTPINAIALGPSGSRAVADPGLVHDGSVGLLLVDPGSRHAISGTELVGAEGDARLGGVLPGLVVPPESPLVTEHHLDASGMSQLLLADFGELGPASRLRLKAEIARLAPTALLNDNTVATAYDLARSQAATVAVFGAVSAAVLVLLGGYLSVQSAGTARRLIQDLGTIPRLRRALFLRWLGVPVLSIALAAAFAYLTAGGGARGENVSFGFWWVLPAAAALLASGVVGLWFVRPSRSDFDVD